MYGGGQRVKKTEGAQAYPTICDCPDIAHDQVLKTPAKQNLENVFQAFQSQAKQSQLKQQHTRQKKVISLTKEIKNSLALGE
jgi:hypothetical protein